MDDVCIYSIIPTLTQRECDEFDVKIVCVVVVVFLPFSKTSKKQRRKAAAFVERRSRFDRRRPKEKLLFPL